MGSFSNYGNATVDAVSAAFMRNHRGAVCIAFSDPTFVRADSIIVQRGTCAIHATLDEADHLLGHVSEAMADAFVENREALLTAMHADGSVFELVAPVRVQ